jgi:hypothetical protein
VDVVDRIGDDEVDVRLEGAHVLAEAERGFDQLAKLPIAESGDTAILPGVFVLEEVGLIAGPAEAEHVGPGIQLAGGIDH